MGGFFGIASKEDCLADVFFGTDYHSHLGTRRGGLAAYDKKLGVQRVIHNIENSPFRTKFEHIFDEMKGTSAIGCISDSDPQPLLIRSALGVFAICMVGVINNSEELVTTYLSKSGHFNAMTGGVINSTELLAALINQKETFAEGIRFAGEVIEGSASILILKDDGTIIAARDRLGRTPVILGQGEDGYCVTFESFAYQKLGYRDLKELGPGEIVEITPDGVEQLAPPGDKMRICAFLWSYYGYSNAIYEGINVEAMRYRNGAIMAEHDMKEGNIKDVDYVGGVPDSGTPHAIGYANKSDIDFARPFIKYTPTWPRSFISAKQADRKKVAKMKQIPVHELITDKNLLF
ncbi:MAG: amidophosphoribosyltransferase, partial [Clostridia bacterium]|nr:amidophosphoribosyltransferase [Clostridia bacterium]